MSALPADLGDIRAVLATDHAYPRVVDFARRFGPAHTALAMHAAIPLSLTPELVNLLRINLVAEAPFIAEADLLLSPLCREVGGGEYEMDPAVRELLVGELLRDERRGPAAARLTAELLLLLCQRTLESTSDAELRMQMQAERWSALAYLQPERAAEELAEAMQAGLAASDREETLRVVRLVSSLSVPLISQSSVRKYAASLERLANGEEEGTTPPVNPPVTGGEEILIGKVALPSVEAAAEIWSSSLSSSASKTPPAAPVPLKGYRVAKVALIGPSGTGKTSLAWSLAGNSGSPSDTESRVVWPPLAVGSGDDERDLMLWTPAEDRPLQPELADADLAVVVIDCWVTSPGETRRWLTMAGAGQAHRKVVLVSTHEDQRPSPRGHDAIGRDGLERLSHELQIPYFATGEISEGKVPHVLESITAAIDWSRIPPLYSREASTHFDHALADVLRRQPGYELPVTEVLSGLGHAVTVPGRLEDALAIARKRGVIVLSGVDTTSPLVLDRMAYERFVLTLANLAQSPKLPVVPERKILDDLTLLPGASESVLRDLVASRWAFRIRLNAEPAVVVPQFYRADPTLEVGAQETEPIVIASSPQLGREQFVLAVVQLSAAPGLTVSGLGEHAAVFDHESDASVIVEASSEHPTSSRIVLQASRQIPGLAEIARLFEGSISQSLPTSASVEFERPSPAPIPDAPPGPNAELDLLLDELADHERFLFYFSASASDSSDQQEQFFTMLVDSLKDQGRRHHAQLLGARTGEQLGYWGNRNFLLGLPVPPAPPGPAERMPEQMERALSNSRVLVALLSPKYFESSWCAKAWAAFAAKRQLGDGPNVVPVLWVPFTSAPDSVSSFQYTLPEFEEYNQLGLRALIEKRRSNLKEIVSELASIVVSRANALPSKSIPIFYDELPSSFYEEPGSERPFLEEEQADEGMAEMVAPMVAEEAGGTGETVSSQRAKGPSRTARSPRRDEKKPR